VRGADTREVLVVGSGTTFLSGVSHYTRYAALALAERTTASVILMRKLIPRALYPGRARVGQRLTDARYPADVPVFDGVDWYWVPSMLGALRLLRRRRPSTLLLQWWTGAVLHSYLLLTLAAKLQGARIIIEIHEIQDTGEASIGAARSYVRALGRVLMRMADAFVVHSDFDRAALLHSFPVGRRPVSVVRHGPYSHYDVKSAEPLREAPADACNLLFFGTIRPYKGLGDLIRAFDLLADESHSWWLTVVGETWEGCTGPIEAIESSEHRDRITLVNRYVSDADAARWHAGADVVVLPYLRSSASGPLHVAMDAGLPVVVSDVGGLSEATRDYPGAVLVPPGEPQSLVDGIRAGSLLRERSFEDRWSWSEYADAVLDLAASLGARR
jgi:glycosyltransferase involved in cell wall biosynthesis